MLIQGSVNTESLPKVTNQFEKHDSTQYFSVFDVNQGDINSQKAVLAMHIKCIIMSRCINQCRKESRPRIRIFTDLI